MYNEAAQLSRLRLGDILLARRLVTREQLQEALGYMQENGGRLGEVLIKLGHLSEPDLKSCLAQQLGLTYEPGPELEVDNTVARLLDEQTAQQLQALPLGQERNLLAVAVVDPLNFTALDHIALKTGKQVRPIVVTAAVLQRALVKVFGIPDAPADEEIAARVYDIDVKDDNPVIKLVNTLFKQALSYRASDIHIEPLEDRVRVRYRVDGALLDANPLPLNLHSPLISRLKVMAGMDIAERRIPQDGQIMIASRETRVDLRLNTVPTVHGERLVARLLVRSTSLRGLDQIGMPPQEEAKYREMIDRPNGLILVTGPTGSGKSTTLMSTLSHLNKPDVNILTIEDPVEYHVAGVSQIQINPRAGLTFASGLRAFLRQDPDIIMVGEIRDGETADIAIRAALTGHLVFSTLHTNQAVGAIGRLIDMGVEPFLLASSLLGVVAQRLVRILCAKCKQPYEVDENSSLRYLPGMPEETVTLYKAKGCGFCEQTGYHGRQAIFEVLPVTPRLRDLISERTPMSVFQQEAAQSGYRTLWQTGLEKALQGITSMEEIRKVAFAEA